LKLKDLKDTLDNQHQLTENEALGYRTTGKALLDLNFKASSLRNLSELEIYRQFVPAYYENPLLAMKWLFFLRDVRGGMGERRSFRVILKRFVTVHPDLVHALIPITAKYGREDDLWCLLETPLKDDVIDYIKTKLETDKKAMANHQPISLLGKWLPSSYSKKRINRRYAYCIYTGLGIGKNAYDALLKSLRDYLKIVETTISNNHWEKVDYSTVPSKANLKYKDAFLRHDKERRETFLNELMVGNEKINAGTLFVHEIVHAYTTTKEVMEELFKGYFYKTNRKVPKEYDATLEALWNNLPKFIAPDQETLIVRDDSGSMEVCIDPNSKVTALEVATALAIYFAQFLKGDYKDRFISFSTNPKLIDMHNATTLQEKLEICYAHSEVSNTNIEKTFDLILHIAVANNYTQDMLPKNIVMISDMEFDHSTDRRYDDTLFNKIRNKYQAYGYELPRLVFWNICGRTNTVPIKENENGVALISGFSQNILQMVLSGVLDPYLNLVNILNSSRYDVVEEAYEKSKKSKG